MGKHAFWVHGNNFRAQREGYFVSKIRKGWGATFRTHGAEWFHICIPTPVILGSVDSKLKKVFVFYQTVGSSMITALHVWDGAQKIASFDGLQHAGEHYKKLDSDNTWAMPKLPHVKYGLGLSVHVDFGGPSKIGVPEILFVSAGGDFVT